MASGGMSVYDPSVICDPSKIILNPQDDDEAKIDEAEIEKINKEVHNRDDTRSVQTKFIQGLF